MSFRGNTILFKGLESPFLVQNWNTQTMKTHVKILYLQLNAVVIFSREDTE